jgi:hypothetical protein
LPYEWLEAYNGAVTAVATVFIALFTIVLAWVTTVQARLTRRAVTLARDEFVSTHRPKLIVREILMLEHIDPIRVRFVIANSGTTKARIIESHVEIQYLSANILLPLQPVEYANEIGATRLKPGSRIFHEHSNTIVEHPEDFQPNQPGDTYLYFRGFIVYAGSSGTLYRTGFCRRYNSRDKRFRIVEDSDYEYAE